MGKKDYSSYQQKVIAGYYDNIKAITLTRLQELVTELYLADSPAKAEKLWQRVHKAMCKLKIKPGIIEHIMQTRSVTILAKNLEDWLK